MTPCLVNIDSQSSVGFSDVHTFLYTLLKLTSINITTDFIFKKNIFKCIIEEDGYGTCEKDSALILVLKGARPMVHEL